ncbi:MAG: hypothetical protein QOH36_439 [Actinomycetota bacterium]|nr:hypothetical protein [Actinomycetota bacterium]
MTGAWSTEQRRAPGSKLLTLPENVEIVPIRRIAYRMAEIAAAHRVSTLGAECVAASEHLDAPLLVWSGDRMLGNGYCTRPVELDCAFETICEGCTYFATSIEFRPTLRRQHRDATKKNQTGRAELFGKLIDGLDPS